MNVNKLFASTVLFKMIYNKKSLINHCVRSGKTATLFCSPHSKVLCMDVFKHKGNLRKFYITESTTKRIENVPVDTSNFDKGFFSHLANINKEVGLVCMPDKLHFIYVIDGLSVKIVVFRGSVGVSDNAVHQLMKASRGFIYIDLYDDSNFINSYVNNILDMICNEDHLLQHDSDTMQTLNLIKRDTEALDKHKEDYTSKAEDVRKCLQAFVFIKYAKVYDETMISLDPSTMKRHGLKLDDSYITKIDSSWDKNLTVINPFGVSGHFRKQPFGTGRKERRIIYIDSFMKSGYVRKAKINQVIQ